jgi:hypothetical protein
MRLRKIQKYFKGSTRILVNNFRQHDAYGTFIIIANECQIVYGGSLDHRHASVIGMKNCLYVNDCKRSDDAKR